MLKFDNEDIGMPIEDAKKGVSGDIYGREGKDWKSLKRAGDTYRNGRKGPTNYGVKKGENQKTPKTAMEVYGEGVKGSTFYGRPGEISEGERAGGVFYNDKISLEKFKKKLGHYDATVKKIGGMDKIVSREGDSDISVEKDAYGKNFVKLKEVYKVANEFYSGFESGEHRLPPKVSRNEVRSPDQIYKFFAEKEATRSVRGKGLEATMILAGLFVFSFVGILLTMQKSGITGFTVANLTDGSINVGVVFCILGVIGLLIYRFKFSD